MGRHTPAAVVLWFQSEPVYGGESARYVVLVGEDNFYRQYEVAIRAFNDEGFGPMSPVVTIRSAMGCKYHVRDWM